MCSNSWCIFNLKFFSLSELLNSCLMVYCSKIEMWKRAVIDNEKLSKIRSIFMEIRVSQLCFFFGKFFFHRRFSTRAQMKSPRVTDDEIFGGKISLARYGGGRIKAGRVSNFHQICSSFEWLWAMMTRRNLITFNFFSFSLLLLPWWKSRYGNLCLKTSTFAWAGGGRWRMENFKFHLSVADLYVHLTPIVSDLWAIRHRG